MNKVTFVITIIFEILAKPLASLFGLTDTVTTEIIEICGKALKIASIWYVLMGISVAIQGVLQSIGYAIKPLVISLFRLVIFVFSIAYIFTLSSNVQDNVWWTFVIAEILTSIISLFILKKSYNKKIANICNNIYE